jgi:hypothetical protein
MNQSGIMNIALEARGCFMIAIIRVGVCQRIYLPSGQ